MFCILSKMSYTVNIIVYVTCLRQMQKTTLTDGIVNYYM